MLPTKAAPAKGKISPASVGVKTAPVMLLCNVSRDAQENPSGGHCHTDTHLALVLFSSATSVLPDQPIPKL